MHFSTTKSFRKCKSKVHDPEGGCQLWHLWHFFPGFSHCRVFCLVGCVSAFRGTGRALLLVLMQHSNRRLDTLSGFSERRLAAYCFYFIWFKQFSSWRRVLIRWRVLVRCRIMHYYSASEMNSNWSWWGRRIGRVRGRLGIRERIGLDDTERKEEICFRSYSIF